MSSDNSSYRAKPQALQAHSLFSSTQDVFTDVGYALDKLKIQ